MLFNTIPPVLPDATAAGPGRARCGGPPTTSCARPTTPTALAAELDTAEQRRRYIAPFYGSRFWAAPGTFEREDVDFMTEPFADAERFRASIANYEYAGGPRKAPEWRRR